MSIEKLIDELIKEYREELEGLSIDVRSELDEITFLEGSIDALNELKYRIMSG